jgi:hypothetical protein
LTEETDGEGRTLLDNLNDMSQQEFAEELDGNDIMEQTVQHINDPDSIRQRKQGSCTATTLQYIQAKEHPADYAKTVAGLTSTEGKVDLGYGGGPIETNKGALKPDESKRDDVSRVYQASAMEYGNGEDMDYVNARHEHIDPETGDKAKEGGGLNSRMYNDMSNAILPYDVENVKKDDAGSWEAVENDIQNTLDDGKQVPVSMKWSRQEGGEHAGHKLSVEDMDDDYVYLRNPHGDSEKGTKPDDKKPEREALNNEQGDSGGHIKMKKDEFYDNLKSYHIPKEIAAQSNYSENGQNSGEVNGENGTGQVNTENSNVQVINNGSDLKEYLQSKDSQVKEERNNVADNSGNNNSQVNREEDDEFSLFGRGNEENNETEFEAQVNENSEAAENYAELSDEEKEHLENVSGSLNSDESQEHLVSLVAEGDRLQDTDADGNTTLENMSEMSQQDFAKELDEGEIMDQMVAHVANPHENVVQTGQGSCAPTSLQFQQANDHPSDYVRTVAGLTSEEGEADVGHGGGTIAVNEEVLEPDDTERDDICRIYQASMADHANGDLVYNNEEHADIDPETGEEVSGGGMDKSEYEEAANAVLPYEVENHNFESMEEDGERIEEALDAGQSVSVAMEWTLDEEEGTRAGHRLTIVDMDDETVTLRNPWGNGEEGSVEDGDKDRPEREAVENEDFDGSGGVVEMSREEFEEYAKYYNIEE